MSVWLSRCLSVVKLFFQIALLFLQFSPFSDFDETWYTMFYVLIRLRVFYDVERVLCAIAKFLVHLLREEEGGMI